MPVQGVGIPMLVGGVPGIRNRWCRRWDVRWWRWWGRCRVAPCWSWWLGAVFEGRWRWGDGRSGWPRWWRWRWKLWLGVGCLGWGRRWCVRWRHIRIGVVDMVCAECMSEWAIGAGGTVCVVGSGGRRGCGIGVVELLVLLLHQIMIPVILLPLRVHGGGARDHWSVGKDHRLSI